MNEVHVSDSIFRLFFEQSKDGMFVTTAEGRFMQVNAALAQLLGYGRNSLYEQPVSAIYAVPSERRRFRYEIESNSRVHNFRISLQHRCGDEIPALVDAVVWHAEDGQIGGYVGTIKLQKAAALQNCAVVQDEDEFAFDLAMRGSSDGLWDWDIAADRVRFSSRFKSLLGYGDFELKENMQEWTSRIHPDHAENFRTSLRNYLLGKSDRFSLYFQMRTRAGNYEWMMVRGLGEFTFTGKAYRIAGSLTHVSAHIRTLEGMRRKEQVLSRENDRLTAERDLLSRYFSTDMMQELFSKDGDISSGKKVNAAVLWLEILDCAHYVELMNPGDFSAFLNELVTDIMDLVYGMNGSVNKILGSRMLITFGCPVSSGDDAENARICAREILAYLNTYNEVRPSILRDPVRIAIGMAYGPVFAGSVGSVRRLEYTVYGKAVAEAEACLAQCRNKPAEGGSVLSIREFSQAGDSVDAVEVSG
ncbi:PAS domain S-box protein [Spirochaeta dissipatitropha]